MFGLLKVRLSSLQSFLISIIRLIYPPSSLLLSHFQLILFMNCISVPWLFESGARSCSLFPELSKDDPPSGFVICCASIGLNLLMLFILSALQTVDLFVLRARTATSRLCCCGFFVLGWPSPLYICIYMWSVHCTLHQTLAVAWRIYLFLVTLREPLNSSLT